MYGEDGKYVRKSITAVDSVWVKPGAIAEGYKFNYKMLDEMLDFYVKGINPIKETKDIKSNSRFDFNILPQKLTTKFRRKANALKRVTPKRISKILENTVGKEILNILNSNEIKKIRIENLKSETDLETFAATKGKSLGATFEEMKILMNSAYIYLPYITSVNKVVKGKNILYKIDGGIIWYHVEISKTGEVSIKELVADETFAIGTSEIGAKDIFGNYKYRKFNFAGNSYNVSEAQYAQYSAILALAKNLGVKTKKIDDFKLAAQIVEVKSGKEYSISLGHKEGLFLDDAFDIIEKQENENGKIITKKVGFARIIKTGDNKKDPTNYSTIKQYIGAPQTEGTLITEHPLLGLDLKLKAVSAANLNIKKEDINFILDWAKNGGYSSSYQDEIITEDANKASGIEGIFSYDLAPIINSPQTFLDLDLMAMLPELTTTTDDTPTIYTYSAYLGLSKKMWFGRFNLNGGMGLGVDMLSFNYNYKSYYKYNYDYYDEYTYDISFLSYGVKLDIGTEYLLSPDLMLDLGITYKISLKPSKVTTKYTNNRSGDEFNKDYTASGFNSTLGGMSIGLGFTYSLGELPFDVFGVLDPLKRY
ncbi:hypothetical protein HLVA_16160 [Haliovirga abyssi]|uniref:Bacterial surface antigen (D15) domain-containing protein n=2 Tax=Haliovirga abyssi TaxID=2996794 RepID=A0AAU9DF57_9FUSO|nr:hypothetical protein HLVA_16160 [Haliovirga abyssi]